MADAGCGCQSPSFGRHASRHFDVRLPRAGTADGEVDSVVQPDITIVCDPDKLKDNHGCLGAPDWVI